ncbi:MAG: 16S rRNA (cytidine(1402)-2'-O)-methyltransferase [Acidobacteriaceae bacterium]|nr:16S rRNA (cytidine(1402)-2'-O)-methyltransferase [Acidobacteriaceae bacterium]
MDGTLQYLSGTLYLVATPIGNLEDLTLRALRVLRDDAAVIACEDTRQTQKLLEHYEIRKPLLSYHEHNEASRTAEILKRLAEGESVALVSDAGTPLISDPGYRVVTEAAARGVKVVPIPGPSAAMTALVASGLPTDEFRFIGFLPPKSAARRRRLETLKDETATVVLYESPHRIVDALADMAEILGERPMVLARELTKIYEEFLRGTPDEIRKALAGRGTVKGEITLVIGGAGEVVQSGDPAAEVARLKGEGVDPMEAIKRVAKQMGLPKREVYRLAMAEGSNPPDTRQDTARKDR